MSEEFGLNKNDFTLVAYDLPNYGKSKVTSVTKDRYGKIIKFNNLPSMEYFELCARLGAKLMSFLNFKTYSVCGWSDGARVASLLAIKYQSRVDSLLLWGFVPIMDEQSCEAVARTRDTSTWNPKVLEFYSDVYGEQKFSELWKEYVDFLISTLEQPVQFDLREQLKHIKCPTMILHGSEDPIVDFRKHVKPLHMQIYDSEIVQIPDMAHNIHQAYPEKFNTLLTTLITTVKA